MRTSVLLAALALTALAAGPVMAQTNYNYGLEGEQQIHTPIGISSFPAGTWEGDGAAANVTDNGNGTATLNEFVNHNNLTNEFDASGTTVPDCFAETTSNVKATAPTGATASITGGAIPGGTVDFGTLNGWVSSGSIYCFERLYSGTTGGGDPILPVLEVGTCGGCAFGAGLQHDAYGTGPGVAPSLGLGPWVFSGDASSFTIAQPLEFFNTLGGAVWGEVHNITGTAVAAVPALMPLAAAALGLGLTFLGARRLRDQS